MVEQLHEYTFSLVFHELCIVYYVCDGGPKGFATLMRWATYRSPSDGLPHAAVLLDGRLHALSPEEQLVDLLGDAPASLDEASDRARTRPFETVSVDEVELLAPVPVPPAVRDFMAFENHYVDTRKGLGLAVELLFYEQPCFYFQNPAAVIGPHADVPLAPGTEAYDFELEVAAVIGRPGRNLATDQASAHVAGYTILCDWSARDLQATETLFGNGPVKGKDTATSLGPYLVTPDELEPYRAARGFDLGMTAHVNGVEYSRGNWSSIYWSIPELLVYASRGTELRPGDVIGTGTVGSGCIMELSAEHGHERYPWLVAGDDVRLRVDQLGEIDGRIVAGAPVEALR
jgi:2-keto-4-pentenoate hydratase/2-oxohepta-3-ene-1,7-dioic acid hydratase in catechol pathway